VGGPARFYAEPATVEALREALAWAERAGVPTFVLGGGSNLLVADRGLDALVLRLGLRELARTDDATHATLSVGAGHGWDALVEHAVAADLAGLEALSGIPGTVGATPIQNVGAYGQEVADTIAQVVAIDRASLEMVTISAQECRFSYRDSEFKRTWRGRHAIVEVAFRLAKGGAPAVRYAELARALDGKPTTLAEVRRTVLALRAGKSMVVSADDENRRSAGSFFTNPIVARELAPRVEARARALGALREGETMPAFDAGPGRTKLSAAWLIERSGLTRGTVRGRVGLSTKHTLAIVNRGGATAREVVDFARFVRDHVAATFDVRLVPEPELVGFVPGELDGLVDDAP